MDPHITDDLDKHKHKDAYEDTHTHSHTPLHATLGLYLLIFIVHIWFISSAVSSIVTKVALTDAYAASAPWPLVDLAFYHTATSVIMGAAVIAVRVGAWPTKAQVIGTDEQYNRLTLVALMHLCGTTLSSVSIALIGSSNTQIFKAAEPICTVILAPFLHNSFAFDGVKMSSLVLVTIGLVAVTLSLKLQHSDSHSHASMVPRSLFMHSLGVLSIILADFALPFRNLLCKQLQSLSVVSCDNVSIFVACSLQVLPITAGFMLLKILVFGLGSICFRSVALVITAATLTTTFELASFLILEQVDAITHSVANVAKRVLTILASFVFFKERISFGVMGGLEIVFVGLYLYTQTGRRIHLGKLLLCVFVVAAALSLTSNVIRYRTEIRRIPVVESEMSSKGRAE